jgi:DegV family protein with EDD domain
MIRIIADTTCSLPQPLLKDHDIPLLPQIIIFGEDSYRDDNEIDTETFLRKLRASAALPKTAAPSPSLYTPIFKQASEAGDTIFVITPSADVSGTFRSATVAAADFPDADIHILDSRTVAGGLGQFVLQAWEWAKQGMDAASLEKNLNAMIARSRTYVVVDTLEYLYKGGRIGGARALFGSLLQIKPILTLRDGHLEPVETQRTKKRAVARMQELVFADCPCNVESRLTICHCDALDEATELAASMSRQLGITDIPIYLAPPAIVVHAGPKILSVSFFTIPAG